MLPSIIAASGRRLREFVAIFCAGAHIFAQIAGIR
jgi:hypothetical protein